MNNARMIFRIYDYDGNYIEASENADGLDLIDINNGIGYEGTRLSITFDMAKDLKDCIDKLVNFKG